jgi:CRISPR-associated protein Cas5d
MGIEAPLAVKVWGDFACFTRPEMKAERVSYPMMTPSAARGILDAILWKPEFSWQVREIWLLRPINYFSILRNEVNSRAVVSTAKKWARGGGGYFAEEDRAQRHTLALRDVCYIIRADVDLRSHAESNVVKYRDMFRRRVERGQCYHMPYLGCREFSAFFAPANGDEQPLALDMSLGRMLFDMEFNPNGSGQAAPKFFDARLQDGKLHVPPELYQKKGE